MSRLDFLVLVLQSSSSLNLNAFFKFASIYFFNVFSDKPALKLGQQFTGTAAETPLTLLFSRLNAAIFPVKRR